MRFIFKDLEVWRRAVKFAEDIITLTGNLNTARRHYRLIENLEAAA